MRRDGLGPGRTRDIAAHVGDQRVLERRSQLFNLSGGQLQIGKLAYGFRQLVGYASCQDSCPFSFRDESSLGHRYPPDSFENLTKIWSRVYTRLLPGPQMFCSHFIVKSCMLNVFGLKTEAWQSMFF